MDVTAERADLCRQHGRAFADLDPEHAQDYRDNAAAYKAQLQDAE